MANWKLLDCRRRRRSGKEEDVDDDGDCCGYKFESDFELNRLSMTDFLRQPYVHDDQAKVEGEDGKGKSHSSGNMS